MATVVNIKDCAEQKNNYMAIKLISEMVAGQFFEGITEETHYPISNITDMMIRPHPNMRNVAEISLIRKKENKTLMTGAVPNEKGGRAAAISASIINKMLKLFIARQKAKEETMLDPITASAAAIKIDRMSECIYSLVSKVKGENSLPKTGEHIGIEFADVKTNVNIEFGADAVHFLIHFIGDSGDYKFNATVSNALYANDKYALDLTKTVLFSILNQEIANKFADAR